MPEKQVQARNQPLALGVYGSLTCEDTALTRDRLRTLGIPFYDHNIQTAPETAAVIERLNAGQVRTPTLVFGENERVLVEPGLDELEQALAEAGYAVRPVRAEGIHGSRAETPAPSFELGTTRREKLALFKLRGPRRTVLFFAHEAACRVCQGYARQLAAQQATFLQDGGQLLIVLKGNLTEAHAWEHEFAPGVEIAADETGALKRAYAERFVPDAPTEGVMLLILDRFTAPRAISSAKDAGGLAAPSEISAWLQLLDCECNE